MSFSHPDPWPLGYGVLTFLCVATALYLETGSWGVRDMWPQLAAIAAIVYGAGMRRRYLVK